MDSCCWIVLIYQKLYHSNNVGGFLLQLFFKDTENAEQDIIKREWVNNPYYGANKEISNKTILYFMTTKRLYFFNFYL